MIFYIFRLFFLSFIRITLQNESIKEIQDKIDIGSSFSCERCCDLTLNRTIFPTCCEGGGNPNIKCFGLPCCSYSQLQNENPRPYQIWFPCMPYLKCRIQNPNQLCSGNIKYNVYSDGKSFICNEPCCHSFKSKAYIWSTDDSSKNNPGRIPTEIKINIDILDLENIFLSQSALQSRYIIENNKIDTLSHILKQIIIKIPNDWVLYDKNVSCHIKSQVDSYSNIPITCVGWDPIQYSDNNCSYIMITLYDNINIVPGNVLNKETFSIIISNVLTPYGISLFSSSKVPVHYLFERQNESNKTIVDINKIKDTNLVFSTFFLVEKLVVGKIKAGLFLPDSISPGFKGNASLKIYFHASLPSNSTLMICFQAGDYNNQWLFFNTTKWIFQNDIATNASGNNTYDISYSFDKYKNCWNIIFLNENYHKKIYLKILNIQNPRNTSMPSNLHLKLYDNNENVIAEGKIAGIPINKNSTTNLTSFNYVSLVVFLIAFLFCLIITKIHGLHLTINNLTIWTDLTAICALISLALDIFNNTLWIFQPSSYYFFVSRIQLIVTFVMLLSIAFHWAIIAFGGPKISYLKDKNHQNISRYVFSIFAILILLFVFFHLFYLQKYRKVINSIYEFEINNRDYNKRSYQLCKMNLLKKVNAYSYSDIQGNIWNCYEKKILLRNSSKIVSFIWYNTINYSILLILTSVLGILGFKVLKKGKKILKNVVEEHIPPNRSEIKFDISIPDLIDHQEVLLSQALRLYYMLLLIIVTIFSICFILKMMFFVFVPYVWWYIFTIWLPNSIPLCCLVFLQWNASSSHTDKVEDEISNHHHLH